MSRERKNKPYAPELYRMCDDEECCEWGLVPYLVRCVHCGQTWPCEDFIAAHSEGEIRRAKRYTASREFGDPWPEIEDAYERYERWVLTGKSA